MDKPKLVAIESKKAEEDLYINAEALEVLKYFTELIGIVGCSELQIVMLDAEMSGHHEGTDIRSTTMLGNLTLITNRYERELDEEAEYFEAED